MVALSFISTSPKFTYFHRCKSYWFLFRFLRSLDAEKMEMLFVTNPDEFEFDISTEDDATIDALFNLMDMESERNLADSLIVSWIQFLHWYWNLVPISTNWLFYIWTIRR